MRGEDPGPNESDLRRSVLRLPSRLCASESYYDPKLSDRDPEARVCAKRREAKARHVPGFMAGAQAVTEPVEPTAARR